MPWPDAQKPSLAQWRVVPKREGTRRTERGLFAVQSPPRSLRPYECHGVVSHPAFWAKNPSPLTIALSQQNRLIERKEILEKEIFKRGGKQWSTNS